VCRRDYSPGCKGLSHCSTQPARGLDDPRIKRLRGYEVTSQLGSRRRFELFGVLPLSVRARCPGWVVRIASSGPTDCAIEAGEYRLDECIM
jgi:hypothetical protein